MRYSNLTYALLFTALAVMQFSCKKEKVVAKPDATINELVDATEIPEVPMDQLLRKDSLIEAVVINGVTSNCLTFNVQQTQFTKSYHYKTPLF